MMRRLFLPLVLVVASGGAAVLTATRAQAAFVKGTLSLPADLTVPRRFVGHWRVDQASGPGQGSSFNGTVVLLVSPASQALLPKTASVEIAGFKASPAVVVVGEGSVVEFHNADKVAHVLSVPGQASLMEPQWLASGAIRKQRFGIAGGYVVRCSEYPHITVSVLVTPSPFFDSVGEKGQFRIGDVPEGKATLKVWSAGRWVHEREINVPANGLDLVVKVPDTSKKPATE